ncbi:uncharacterized protein [Cicer arietinum]|uniref:Glutamic acid-rich protein n=1 Tax=Cicer arietinum TaxID=3827 RepID=A0A1S2YRV4_CICAR|nr:glutamic acid-rich protein [Cicer arietinum]
MTNPNPIQKHTLNNAKQNQKDPNKFHYNFVYKTAIVLIFFVILPLFPSQAPEFIHQNLLTRNWELLHLLFVGIAISYGLFSRRNQETENNNNSKFDTAQSLVSRFLQVSSFFEDETDQIQNTSHESEEITKIQTWSNQHYRNKPMVVVTPPQVQKQQHSVFEDEEQSGFDEKEKPLLLPVRSLKSRLSDDDDVFQLQSNDGSSKIISKNISSKSFNRVRNFDEFEGKVEEKIKEKENVVLPSPIPWRSRSASARMMMESKQEDVDKKTFHEKASKSSMEESRGLKFSSSMKFIPSESVAKNSEDLTKKKSFCYKSCCPPPPPPPPPTMFQKSRYGLFDKEMKKNLNGEKNGRSESLIGNGEERMNEKEEEKYHSSSMQEGTVSLKFGGEEKERVIVESEEEEEEEEEEEGKESTESEEASMEENIKTEEGPDVDKKADEFIAKFREQIRLQRIESIKSSTRRVPRNSST